MGPIRPQIINALMDLWKWWLESRFIGSVAMAMWCVGRHGLNHETRRCLNSRSPYTDGLRSNSLRLTLSVKSGVVNIILRCLKMTPSDRFPKIDTFGGKCDRGILSIATWKCPLWSMSGYYRCALVAAFTTLRSVTRRQSKTEESGVWESGAVASA